MYMYREKKSERSKRVTKVSINFTIVKEKSSE